MGERTILKSEFSKKPLSTTMRRSLRHMRILLAVLLAVPIFFNRATFNAGAAEDADSAVKAMSEAHKQFRIPMSNNDLALRIETFLDEFFAKRSSSDVESLKLLEGFYSKDVMHMRKQIRREVVMSDLRKHSVQWPERSYKLDHQNLHIECFEKTDAVKFPTCYAVGFVDWTASGGASDASGKALYEIEIIVYPSAPAVYSQSAVLTQWRGGPAPQVPLPLP
jgi:hypothetical protein